MVYALIQPTGDVWKKLCYRELAEQVVESAPADVQPLTIVQWCDYCESAPATGYVRAYDAHVCRPCYDDHHGLGCE